MAKLRVRVGLRVENFCTGRVRVRKVVPVQYSILKVFVLYLDTSVFGFFLFFGREVHI